MWPKGSVVQNVPVVIEVLWGSDQRVKLSRKEPAAPLPQDVLIWHWHDKGERGAGAVWQQLCEQTFLCCTYLYHSCSFQSMEDKTLSILMAMPLLIQLYLLSKNGLHTFQGLYCACNLMAAIVNMYFLLTISLLEKCWFFLWDGLISKQPMNMYINVCTATFLCPLLRMKNHEPISL